MFWAVPMALLALVLVLALLALRRLAAEALRQSEEIAALRRRIDSTPSESDSAATPPESESLRQAQAFREPVWHPQPLGSPPTPVPSAGRVGAAPGVGVGRAEPKAEAAAGDAVAGPVGDAQVPTAGAASPDAALLEQEMRALMARLVEQGRSVREIAALVGLSEAEAELMVRLHQGAR